MRLFTGSDAPRARLPIFASLAGCTAILTFVLVGCGGSSGGNSNNTPPVSLVGTWRQVQAASGNGTTDCPGAAVSSSGVENVCTVNDTLTFATGDAFTANTDGIPATGTYSVSNGRLRLTVSYPTPTPTASPSATPAPTSTPTPLSLTNSIDINFNGTDEFTLQYESNDVRFRDTFQRQVITAN